MTYIIPIEEDGDEIFISIEHGCLNYECQYWERGKNRPTHPKLIKEDGFWICPSCERSYGPIEK